MIKALIRMPWPWSTASVVLDSCCCWIELCHSVQFNTRQLQALLFITSGYFCSFCCLSVSLWPRSDVLHQQINVTTFSQQWVSSNSKSHWFEEWNQWFSTQSVHHSVWKIWLLMYQTPLDWFQTPVYSWKVRDLPVLDVRSRLGWSYKK